jgi:hypothetical protein
MRTRRFLFPIVVTAAALAFFAACGSDEPALDTTDDTQVETPVDETTTTVDPAGGIDPADGVVAPAEEVVSGRVVAVDRDGPSVEIQEATIVTGSDATDAARAAGEIGPDEEWDLDFYVVEGERRWIDIDPSASVAVFDCTQACEHVEGTLEHVLSGAPYGGPDALWSFVIGDGGLAVSVDEIYLP